ncbi:protein SIX6OS1 [Neopelma chrysocephalum]|uniref:protein SIX6OS1 n=1 Tax=Neopelma chrysocephalum TaxID=114329 RepID=UPI000FCD2461|nr:protein SIX6OS1 [Neopelma chrysocephalum]XP_027558181.1 protein SIX6OS1 [Neopelma chrysocephalum]XP_027558182.1 protein SIX6OS1 [Neopelma chrysocephalum]XP_027558183.1 protein SIX6OS1 [Neopelma chrysocephalum]XP_027558184.1 protein SIX6OS1 [Neopelma chrysocephalum]
MSDKLLTNLDKLLVELAFQVEQTSFAKERVNQQINSHTAEIAEKRNKIAKLEENIKKGNEEIADLKKQNESNKKNCNVWKPTYKILGKHEEYVKNELEALEEATENERKMYEDCIIQYKEVLEEHHKKYAETALAQRHYKKKEEVEEIHKRVLKHWKKHKRKEDACLDLEAVPFKSVNDWTVHIASSKQKTQEMLHLATVAAQEFVKLKKEAEELEMKIGSLKKRLEAATEDQDNSEMIEGKNQKSLEKPEEFKERMFEEPEHSPLPKEKHERCKPLPVLHIPQKLVQSVHSMRFSNQQPETGREEKEKPMELPVATSSSSNLAENLSEMVIDTAGTNNPQIAQVPLIASIQTPVKFRVTNPPRQLTSSQQQFESKNAVKANQEAKRGDKEAEEPKESSHIPQDVHTSFNPNEDNPDIVEESAEPFLRAPKTPDLKGKKMQFSETPPFDFIQNLGCEEGTSKSPAFFSLMNFSQKSPGFNFFGSSVFGAQNSSDEAEENFSVGNLNTQSPHKDIGSLFGKPESEDAFAFPFASESTSHAFGDGKDDFSFPFAFGQDQRSSQSPSMKGFHSSLQNTKQFTLF